MGFLFIKEVKISEKTLPGRNLRAAGFISFAFTCLLMALVIALLFD